MNDNYPKAKVTLEDLLRVKRAEQPPAEFWAEFERGMRTKQLAAIIEPRPWWAPFIKVGARVARFQVPVGAAAILAITFVTVREYRTIEVAPVYEPVVASVASISTVAAGSDRAVLPAASSATTSAALVVSEGPLSAPAVSNGRDESSIPASSQVGAVSHVAQVQPELTPSARYIAENLAAARLADPELDQMLGRSMRSLDNRANRVDPLAQVSVPGQSRLSRLMGANAWQASMTSGSDSALRTDEHSSSRLTERRLSESDAISRVDLGGSRVSLKF